jgi:hypothetical protein
MIEFKKMAMVVLLAGQGFTGTSHAALFDRGNGMIYDSDQNITWSADANLFQTQAASNPNLVNQIIAANNGVIHDTPNIYDTIPNSGIYTLTTANFNTSTGRMDWFGAQAWAHSLSLGGYSDWRLPTTNPAVSGSYQTASEMGHLFYIDLGINPVYSITSSTSGNYAPFSNLQPYGYWSESEFTLYPNEAWDFNTFFSDQHSAVKLFNPLYALAVRTGDVTATPVPAALWLFTSGLGLLVFTHRKKSN